MFKLNLIHLDLQKLFYNFIALLYTILYLYDSAWVPFGGIKRDLNDRSYQIHSQIPTNIIKTYYLTPNPPL